MLELWDRVQQSVTAIRKQISARPAVAIILGTGLGGLADEIEDPKRIPYNDIPNFVRTTVAGHAGRLVVGQLAGKDVVVMEGRVHYYEGYSMEDVTFPVRVARALGATNLLVTTAAGGLNPYFYPGDLMVIEDHVNLMGANPLIGPNDERIGPRYPDMIEPYSRRLIETAQRCALEEGIPLHKGVLVALSGPCLETRAEYRVLRMLGADAVAMSVVPEVIVGVHGGMDILGIAAISDRCLPDVLEPVNIKAIIAAASAAAPKLSKILLRALGTL